MDRSQLCDSLIIWMQTFGLDKGASSEEDYCDGVLMSEVLHQIAPEYFSSHWLSKIKTDEVTNWRLKVSNLKRVLNGIVDYYAEILNLVIPNSHMPDVGLIGESCDRVELGRMLQLILSCAVNCQEKQEYIQRIMNLEESVQHVVMTSIQELMTREREMSMSSEPDSELNQQVKNLTDKLSSAAQENEELAQRCHELDLQVTTLQDENHYLTAQHNKLSDMYERQNNIDDPATPAGRRLQQHQNQIVTLQEEVFRIEAAKEDLKIKGDLLIKDNADLRQKVSELSPLANQASNLRDEVDILRHTSEQVERYETAIASYKRQFDELSELKEQLRISDEKLATLLTEKNSLQEEVKKSGSLKEQLYDNKKQVLELQNKLAEQVKIADKVNADAASREINIDMLRKEKERLLHERDSLKELNDELQCAQLSTAGLDMAGDNLNTTPHSPQSLDMLSIPLPIRQRIIHLEHDVKDLRPKADRVEEVEGERDAIRVRLEEADNRHAHLQNQLESANERLVSADIDKTDLEIRLSQRDENVGNLKQSLRQLREDMIIKETTYKKYLDKARSLILQLDPNLNPSSVSDDSSLKTQIHEKDKTIRHLETELDRGKHHKETERKLMVTAWYNMGMQLHRRDVDERLSNTSTVGQSFLARQRQAHSRRGLPHPPLATQLMNAKHT